MRFVARGAVDATIAHLHVATTI